MNALVPEAFRLFRAQFPHISLSLAAGNARDTLAAITDGAAELALLGKNPQRRARVAPDATRPRHRSGPSRLRRRNAGTSAHTLFRRLPARIRRKRAFSPLGPKSPEPLTVNDIDAARILALQGVGSALLPESRARDDLRAGRLKRVATEGMPLPVGDSRPSTPQSGAFPTRVGDGANSRPDRGGIFRGRNSPVGAGDVNPDGTEEARSLRD